MKHYRFDQRLVNLALRYTQDQMLEDAERTGFLRHLHFELVPLRQIKPEQVWKQVKLTKVLSNIKANKPLGPVLLLARNGKFEIQDGIHRYNASRQMGFTHIPAVVETLTPYTPEQPESKPVQTYRVGQWVQLTPVPLGVESPFAMVAGDLGSGRYELLGVEDDQEGGYIGDFTSDQFEPVSGVPASVKRIIEDTASWWLKSASLSKTAGWWGYRPNDGDPPADYALEAMKMQNPQAMTDWLFEDLKKIIAESKSELDAIWMYWSWVGCIFDLAEKGAALDRSLVEHAYYILSDVLPRMSSLDDWLQSWDNASEALAGLLQAQLELGQALVSGGLHKNAARPIPLGNVDSIVDAYMNTLYRLIEGVAEEDLDKPVSETITGGDPYPQYWEVLVQETPIKNVKGYEKTALLYLRMNLGSGLGNFSGEHVGLRGAKAKINVAIAGGESARFYLSNVEKVREVVNKVFIHELTHFKDIMSKSQYNINEKPPEQWTREDRVVYTNDPNELKAQLQEIIYQVDQWAHKTAKFRRGRFDYTRQTVEYALKASKTWQRVKDYLTPKNRKYYLKAIGQHLVAIAPELKDLYSRKRAPGKSKRQPPGGKRRRRLSPYQNWERRTRETLARKLASKFQEKKEVPKAKGKGTTTVYTYSDRHINKRHREKAKRVEKLRNSIADLRQNIKRDLKSSDEKTRLIALIVGLIDHTYERVGNDESAKEGHFGVTGFQAKHVTFSGGKATLKYVGKSGVKQNKTVTDKALVSALKKAAEGKSKADSLFVTSEGVSIDASDVNAFLKPFKVTAKDIRGLHANQEVQKQLKAIRSSGPKLPEDRKERKKLLKEEFKKAVEEAAKAVGHEASTLKSQYLVPGMGEDFLDDGEVNKSLEKKAFKAAFRCYLKKRGKF